LQRDASDSGVVTMAIDGRGAEDDIRREGDEVLVEGFIHFLAVLVKPPIWKTKKGDALNAKDLRCGSRFLGARSGKILCGFPVLLIKGAAVGNNNKGGCRSTLRIPGDSAAAAETFIVGMRSESEDASGGW
jgi:hypothetical protein